MTGEQRPGRKAPIELRQTSRNPVSWRARVVVGASVVDCRTSDISLGGVGLLCDRGLPREVPLRVALQVTPSATMEGRIVTSTARAMFQVLSGHEYRIGMQWTAPDDPALAVLGAWSRRRE